MDEDSIEEERYKKLGFKPQKEIIYNRFLPYADKLDDESLKLYTDIKTNLVKSVLLREMRPGCVLWVSRLNKYIKVFGLKFSKEDHIALIKLLFELITIPDLEPTRVNKFATTLTLLLKKKELISSDELQLPWRPLYDLFARIIYSSRTSVGMYRYFSSLDTNLEVLIHAARIYFPASATQEMLDEWRPKMCPYDSTTVTRTIQNLEFFLPVMVKPAEAKISYELWFNEFMSFWEVCHNAPVWEMDMLWMMARLAMYTIGYIDWEPHMPLMFTRFLRSLDLPVSYKQRQSQKHHKLETTPMAVWIVAVIGGGSSALDHLQKFMQTIESYYHPANAGRWSIKLRELFRNIPFYFVQRLHRERYKEKSWGPEVPETHRLTEGDIDRFVEIMTPVVGHVVYSRQATSDVSSGLQHLATLRPAQVVPLVLDKLYATLDTVTEPHKLTACMQCVVAVARPLLQGPAHGYPEGPTHVIPLLTALLPGIDPNDIRKCLVTFQFISTFVSMIPLVDSSAAAELWSDLTDEEHAICEASAGLPDFVLQFFRRVFTLVQSSSLEVTRLEQVDSDKRSKLEAVAESALSSICNVIVMQTSERIFKSALRKLYDFVCENILETKVSGQMVAIMVKSFIRIRPEDTLRLFVPRLCSRVHELMDEGSHDVRDDETLDTELLYNLLILSEMLDCNGSALLPHVEQLTAVLDRTLHLACTQGYVMATRLLNHVLISLTFVQPLEYRSAPPPFYEGARDRLPVREWGAPGDIHDLRVTWYTPGPAEIQCAQHLVNRYLVPEMEDLNSFVDDRLTITREVMRRKLGIVVGCLGAQSVLPVWQEKACLQVPSRLDPWAFEMIIGTALTISLPDGGNVRKALAELAGRLQKKLLSCAEDDTKSFFNLIGIWDALIMTKYRGRDFESHWKNFHLVKKVLADCLRGGKQHLRPLLIDRVMLHQEFRTESRSFTFTDTHRHILHHLYQLSTSHYGEVRVRAQKKLFLAVSSFPYAYSALTPLIKTTLQMDCRSNHEEFKGCLYVLLGPKSTPIIARHDWTFVSEIWPCLVTSTPSEKPSVINLMNLMVDAVHKHFPTISIKLEIPERCLDAARVLTSLHISQREVDEGVLELERISALNEQLYGKVLDTLHGSVVSGNLHWRYHTMALSFIRDLVHPNVKYGANIVRYILAALVHDSLEIRKLAICIMVYILKQQKRPHKKVEIDPRGFTESTGGGPGVREDNLWVQYDRESRPRSSDEWDRPRFLHKVYSGFYVWPDTVQVYAPSSEQPCLDRPVDQLSAQEQEIDAFFSNQDNIDSLIRFMSLEEKKGRDKFNGGRFIMFKNLFRNHGDKFLDALLVHLERLVIDKEEHNQRCAAEIMAAVIRGSKHWPYAKVERLWGALEPLVRLALANMTVETVSDWGVCFATAAENRDPNRQHWLYELLMERPLQGESSFVECGKMYTLQGALNQQVWRVSQLMHRLVAYLAPYLTHPFQNVRNRVSSVLVNAFETDVVFPAGGPTNSLRIGDFVRGVVPRLQVLHDVKDDASGVDCAADRLNNIHLNETDRETAIRLFKTVCKWIIGSITRTNFGSVPAFYELFPLACQLQSYEADEELTSVCSAMLALLAQAMTLARDVPVALGSVSAVSDSRSWSARAACAEFLQVFVFHNMATVASDLRWVHQIKGVVLKLLEDEKPEVRVQASQVLGGLLHCQFLPYSQELLDHFKQKAKTKLSKSAQLGEMRKRHCGVLGMCAFINAHPYDVPDLLPDVFRQLGAHLNDPQPIPTTIRKTMSDFKRTHHDNWHVHQLRFTEDELCVLSDLTVPPSYYA